MSYVTKEEIEKRIQNYDLSQLIKNFYYVNKCKSSLIEVLDVDEKVDVENFKEVLSYFMRIEECVYEKIFNSK